MADLRIYELTDEQASYSTGIYVQVDNSGFSNTKKMDIATIYPKTDTLSAAGNFNPDTTLLRTDNGSGDESQLTITDMFADTDVKNIIKLIDNTGWKTYLAGDVTKNSAKVNGNNFICNALSVLGLVFITGVIELTSPASEDEILFTLPSSIPVATQAIYFGANDDSSADINSEFYIQAGSRQIRQFSPTGSGDREMTYQVMFPAI